MENRNITMWDACAFFKRLVSCNKLCQDLGFVCVEVSGLDGLEEALATMQKTANLVMVSENAAGLTRLDNTPHNTKVRTVFIAMRYKHDDMAARKTCMNTIFELHRQFASVLIRESVRIQEKMQHLNPEITLQEVDKYLVPDTAICMFELAVNTYIDLQYNPLEWTTSPIN